MTNEGRAVLNKIEQCTTLCSSAGRRVEAGSTYAYGAKWVHNLPTEALLESVMLSPEVLERFIAKVESNAHVEAIESFYAPHASMQENEQPPRTSRDALVAHESNFLSRLRSLRSKCVRPAFVNGDHVVIRWVFEFEALDGTRSRLE